MVRNIGKHRIDVAGSIYKTWNVEQRKYRVDIERSLVSNNFIHYIEMGGMLSNSIDYFRLVKAFPKGL